MSAAQLISIAEDSVRLEGRVDYDTVPALARQMDAYWQALNSSHLSVDMSQVTHINTAGMALLIDWFKKAQKKGIVLKFSHVPAQLIHMAALTRVNNILNLSEEL